MATVTFTLSNAALTEFIDAQAFHYGYKENIPDPENLGQTITNPETKAQFARRMAIQHYLKERIHAYRRATKLTETSTVDPDIT